MIVAIGSDHGGYALKEHLKAWLDSQGIACRDMGCGGPESCDYPVYGEAVGRAVASGECQRGIVICTTGIGISITANKVGGIRCALCGDLFTAEMTRRHNDANMLALGGGIVGPNLAVSIVETFLNTPFSEEEKHKRRVAML